MRISKAIWVTFALTASAAVFAQTRIDRSFTATGESCDDVVWSEQALEQYPRIASACREVLERDGRYYVLFEGDVERVSDRGRQITVDFEQGDRLTLTPPDNLTIFMDGQRTRPSDLRPGDRLNFYIPQDQFVATFFAGEPTTAPAEEAEIVQEREPQVAAADTRSQQRLPATASGLPALGLGGLVLLILGAGLTLLRRMRG